MYTSFSIENFRLFDKLTVEPLARVNLIAGQNNVGKTALLEALWMASHPTSPRDALRIALRRDSNDFLEGELFAGLFPRYDSGAVIKLQGIGDDNSYGDRTLKIYRRDSSRQPAVDWTTLLETESAEDVLYGLDLSGEMAFEYVDEKTGNKVVTSAWVDVDSRGGELRPALGADRKSSATHGQPCLFERPGYRASSRTLSARFGKAEMDGFLPAIEKIVRLLEPRLERMTTISNSRGTPLIHGDIGLGRLIPITAMGEGTKRLLALSLAFLNARNGVLLIDEIENGLYHNALVDIWKSLDWLSREFNVQVFATTHSYECIVAANSAFTEMESDDLHFHRLSRKGSKVQSVSYRKKPLNTNIEYFWELR